MTPASNRRSSFAIYFSVALLALSFSSACSTAPTSPEIGRGPDNLLMYRPASQNSAEQINKPYVILVSIDGYRHDYNKLFSPPHLTRLANEGVAAESLRPVYPSKTFPNHYTLVTGLTADRHGIVSNEFYDPARDAVYSLPDRKAVEDGKWYFGEPIWITAQKQGLLSASYFWVGSEANIQGMHPNYFYRYDDKVANSARVDQVLKWLKLPAERRPHFITLYFDDVDTAGHQFGVNSDQTRKAVLAIDEQIGRLREGIAASGLPVNLVVVSDHGMQDLEAKKTIVLDETPEAARLLAKFKSVGRGPQMLLYLNKGEDPTLIAEAEKILNALATKAGKTFRVHRRDQMGPFRYTATPRTGDLIVEPDAPYSVGLKARMPSTAGANHGWDPVRYRAMHGIFYAHGPAFRENAKLPTMENVNVYPLLLAVLGLQQLAPIDGQLEPIKGALRPAR